MIELRSEGQDGKARPPSPRKLEGTLDMRLQLLLIGLLILAPLAAQDRGPLRSVEVSGRVIDNRGGSVAGASIDAVIRYGDHDPSSSFLRLSGSVDPAVPTVKSDAKGRFRLKVSGRVPGPSWLVWISGQSDEHSMTRFLEVHVALEGPRVPVELVLYRDRRVRGRVLDKAGVPAAGAQVIARPIEAWRLSRPGMPDSGSMLVNCDEQGFFDIAKAPECRLSLSAQGPGIVTPAVETCPARDDDDTLHRIEVRRTSWIGIEGDLAHPPFALRLDLEELGGPGRLKNNLEAWTKGRGYINGVSPGLWTGFLRGPRGLERRLPRMRVRSREGAWIKIR